MSSKSRFGMLALLSCRPRTAFVFNVNNGGIASWRGAVGGEGGADGHHLKLVALTRPRVRCRNSYGVLFSVTASRVFNGSSTRSDDPAAKGPGMRRSSGLCGVRRGGGGRQGGRGHQRLDFGPARAGQHSRNVSPGTSVEVVQKQDQRSGALTSGIVSRLLTNSGYHPRGIKVMLVGGVVGRVQNISSVDEPAPASAGGAIPRLHNRGGYSSSGSSSTGGGSGGATCGDGGDVGYLATSETAVVRTSRRRKSATDRDEASLAAAAPAPVSTRHARPMRSFRAGRVQGRSWSVEGGEVVARGAGGEELSKAEAIGAGELDGKRGRGGRRRRGGRR